MAITETVLGPNSSQFTFTATDTTATIMAALDTYITAHGWELYDNAAGAQGVAGTNPVGRVYRALQSTGSSLYKYVGVIIASGWFAIKIYDSWNASTHTGTNAQFYLNTAITNAVDASSIASNVGTDGAAIIMFVHPKWLAARTKTNANILSNMIGCFEISKDYGEDPTFPSHIFMSTGIDNRIGSNGTGSYGAGIYSSPKVYSYTASTLTGASAVPYCTVLTPFGGIFNGGSLANMLPTAFSGATTMVAAELASPAGNLSRQALLRGRIFGLKLGYGSVAWNDMDTAQIVCDSNYFENASGTATTFHIFYLGTSTSMKYMLPA